MIGKRNILELMGENVSVDINAPLMEAVHMMVKHNIVTLPVMKAGELVGVIREKDIILEIAKNLGTLEPSGSFE